MGALESGARVRYTVDGLGVMVGTQFVPAGHEGHYISPHPDLRGDGWHLIRIEHSGRQVVCPVHTSQFEAAE